MVVARRLWRVYSCMEKGEDGRYNALCSTEKSNSSGMTRYALNLLRTKSNFKVTFPEINGSAEVCCVPLQCTLIYIANKFLLEEFRQASLFNINFLQCSIYKGRRINTRPPMRAGWWNCFSGKNVQLYSSTRLLCKHDNYGSCTQHALPNKSTKESEYHHKVHGTKELLY